MRALLYPLELSGREQPRPRECYRPEDSLQIFVLFRGLLEAAPGGDHMAVSKRLPPCHRREDPVHRLPQGYGVLKGGPGLRREDALRFYERLGFERPGYSVRKALR